MKRSVHWKTIGIGILLGLGALMADTASASFLAFGQSDQVAQRGQLTYGGGSRPLFGSLIGFDSITLEGADAPDGHADSLACFGCALTFNTGFRRDASSGTWDFDALGSNFQITGDAYATGADGTLADTPIASGVLWSSVFDGPQQLALSGTGFGDDVRFTGSGSGQQDSELLNYFGLGDDLDAMFETFLSGTIGGLTDNGGFLALVDGARAHTAVTNDVPEPAGWAVLALGLILLLIGWQSRQSTGRAAVGG
ncbi:hypothetical protein [Salinisphaera sp. Q1T1-3]|uniref:hypothetical protein n=1 Tax=Salinisphaera sp. Q1T1-3 TaxID=2321229 RepID=UPI0011C3A7AA|nr:hypothetical protein [Salinisphaera sp. Q1T1-3]